MTRIFLFLTCFSVNFKLEFEVWSMRRLFARDWYRTGHNTCPTYWLHTNRGMMASHCLRYTEVMTGVEAGHASLDILLTLNKQLAQVQSNQPAFRVVMYRIR